MMEDLIIVMLILISIFLVACLFGCRKKNKDNSYFRISCIVSLFGLISFMILQLSVSNYDIFKQTTNDDLKKEISVFLLLLSFLVAIFFSLFNKKKNLINNLILLFEIIIFVFFGYMKILSYAFIL